MVDCWIVATIGRAGMFRHTIILSGMKWSRNISMLMRPLDYARGDESGMAATTMPTNNSELKPKLITNNQ
ncbi:hypothetical protein [Olivibacter domesticus]|uniref:hypothetical protein n=1 Tax=Olivibacter domesticus TaxID=407022 RepID=UPI000B874CF2|nr:hypothetical protein [Olivibacter domesticus]